MLRLTRPPARGIGVGELLPAVKTPISSRNDQPTRCGSKRAREPSGRARRAAGGEHVVYDQRPRPGRQRVAVGLERVGPVLQRVRFADAFPRQLAGLPRRYEPRAERGRHGAAQDEAAGLDADHVRDPRSGERRGHRLDHLPEQRRRRAARA